MLIPLLKFKLNALKLLARPWKAPANKAPNIAENPILKITCPNEIFSPLIKISPKSLISEAPPAETTPSSNPSQNEMPLNAVIVPPRIPPSKCLILHPLS